MAQNMVTDITRSMLLNGGRHLRHLIWVASLGWVFLLASRLKVFVDVNAILARYLWVIRTLESRL